MLRLWLPRSRAILTGAQTHVKLAFGANKKMFISILKSFFYLNEAWSVFRTVQILCIVYILLKSSSGLKEKHRALFRSFGIIKNYSPDKDTFVTQTRNTNKVSWICDFPSDFHFRWRPEGGGQVTSQEKFRQSKFGFPITYWVKVNGKAKPKLSLW